MSFVIINCTEKGRLRSFNANLRHLLGYSEAELLTLSLSDLMLPPGLGSRQRDKIEHNTLSTESIVQSLSATSAIWQLRHKNGKYSQLVFSCSETRTGDKGRIEYVLVGTPLNPELRTEKKAAAAATTTVTATTASTAAKSRNLKPAEEIDPKAEMSSQSTEANYTLANLSEHIPAYIYYLDQELRIRYVNNAVREVFDESTDYFLGKLIEEISLNDSYNFSLPYFEKARNGEFIRFQIDEKLENGQLTFDINLLPDIQESGVKGFTIIAYDITEKVAMEQQLFTSEQKFRSLITNTSDHISIIDRNYCYTYINHIAEGFEIEDIIGQSIFLGVTQEDVPRISSIIDGIFESGKPANYEVRVRMHDGSVIWYHATGNALFENGNITGIMFVSTDITELKFAGDKAAEARTQAEMANRAKTEFLSSMSHELRTPLNSILGFSQVLESNPEETLTETQQSCVNLIKEAGEHLLVLINEILNLAKIEAGKVDLFPQDLAVKPLLEECLDCIKVAAEDQKIQLIESACADSVLIRADYTRVKQVLLNLLSNAIKYNRKGGKVFLHSNVEPTGMLNISIRDTGKGIDEAKQHELFQPFSRLGQETTAIEGTGIGLTISKKLVELMEGNIGFESKPGEGSTFWIELPLAAELQLSEQV